MGEEEGFLLALEDDPADDTTRLVYADWLDERGEHVKAEYLRLGVRAAAAGLDPPEGRAAADRLRELGPTLPPGWTAGDRFEVVFGGIPGPWRWAVTELIERGLRIARDDVWTFIRCSPAVLLEGFPFGQAEARAAELTQMAVEAVEAPGELGQTDYHREGVALFRTQLAGRVDRLFTAGVTRAGGADGPARFDVVAAQPGATPLFWGGIAAEFLCDALGVTTDDAEYLLQTGGPVVLRAGGSFLTAVRCADVIRKKVRQHPMARTIRDFAEVSVVPYRPSAEPPPEER